LRKPRENGITMVIDKGVGPAATEDYLDLVGGTVDLLKLAFGTTAFYSEPILRRKIEICARHGVACYPGGTFLKVDPSRPARRQTLSSRPTAANSVTTALPP
jgi:phosphosulfolactate synthase